MSQIVAPDLLMSVAREMVIGGWQPLWCLERQNGAYTPMPGTTGHGVTFPVVLPQPASPHRLAFRPPLSVVIFDVDHYDGKRGADIMDAAEEWLGDLPLTYKVTSRGEENPSGRYLYRKPEDLEFSDSALAQFGNVIPHKAVEIVRTGYRFSWAPGDVNHKNGKTVQCFDPMGDICLLPPVDALPELPERWVNYLRNPPVPQEYSAYTRPADGPQWWLGQADDSLPGDAELSAFAFQMMLSRVPLEEIWEQWQRVSLAANPAWPWTRSDFDRHIRSQAQDKAAVQIAREDAEEAMFERIAGGADAVKRITDKAQAEYENKQVVAAALEPQVPFDPAMYEEITHVAGVTVPHEDADKVPLGHRLRRLPEYDRLLWQELSRHQVRKDAAAILAGQFAGFTDIADLPEPPEPETLAVTGKDQKSSRCIGRATITVMSGQRSSGKTWAVAAWAAQELRAGNKVVWLDFERQDALLASKMRVLGIPRHVLRGQLQYSPALPPADRLVREVERASNFGQYRVLLVVDAFRTLQALVAPGTSAIDGDAVEQVYVEYLTPAVEAGANVVLLDHMSKSGTTTFGSERKESAPDYVIRVEKLKPFSKRSAGYSSLTVAKDRYGNADDGAVIGYLWMPGDGSASAAEGITKYPERPELRNWPPEEVTSLADVPGASDKGRKEEAITAIVRDNPLALGPRPLGQRVHETFPDLFTSAKAATDFAARMRAGGLLAKEEGKDGKYDLPPPVKEVHKPPPAISPADLEHPDA